MDKYTELTINQHLRSKKTGREYRVISFSQALGMVELENQDEKIVELIEDVELP